MGPHRGIPTGVSGRAFPEHDPARGVAPNERWGSVPTRRCRTGLQAGSFPVQKSLKAGEFICGGTAAALAARGAAGDGGDDVVEMIDAHETVFRHLRILRTGAPPAKNH